MYLARQREVVIPSIALGGVQFVYVAAAAASASVDEGVVTDGFLTEFSEAMTACFMLHHATGVERIAVGAERTEGDCRPVCPHLRYAAIVGGVGHYDDESLTEVVFRNGGCSQGVREYLVVFGFQSGASRKGGAEAVVADGIHRTDARLRRQRHGGVDVEILAVGFVWLYTEEIFHLLIHHFQIFARGNFVGVITVAKQYDVDATTVAACRLLQRHPFVLAILVAILRNAAFMGVVLVFQPEHHLSVALAAGAFRRCLDGDCNISLLVAAHWRHLTPVWLACHLPFAFGIDGDGLLMLRTEGASYRGATCQFVVGGDALEVAPALSRLIMCYSGRRNLNGEIFL